MEQNGNCVVVRPGHICGKLSGFAIALELDRGMVRIAIIVKGGLFSEGISGL